MRGRPEVGPRPGVAPPRRPLALPRSAGALRDHRLALDARGGAESVTGAEVASAEETYEALVARLGVCLVAAGDVPLISLGGVTVRPVRGPGPSRYAPARRPEHARRPLVRAYAEACRLATDGG